MKWYVLFVKAGEEVAIRDSIKKAGFTALVPRKIVFERRQGITSKRVKTIFSSYVFINIDFEPKIYYRMKRVAGVIRFLGAGGPEPVPEREMNFVFKLCAGGETAGISNITIEVGDKIKVLDGPLKDFEGKIIHLDRRKKRAKVRLTLFGRVHDIDMGVELIQARQEENLEVLA
jgi:transcriptional antiterminator NusG